MSQVTSKNLAVATAVFIAFLGAIVTHAGTPILTNENAHLPSAAASGAAKVDANGSGYTEGTGATVSDVRPMLVSSMFPTCIMSAFSSKTALSSHIPFYIDATNIHSGYFEFPGWAIGPNKGEGSVGNPWELRASWSPWPGVKYRLTFGGKPTLTMTTNTSIIRSDPVFFAFKPGTKYFVDTFVTCLQTSTNTYSDGTVGGLTSSGKHIPVSCVIHPTAASAYGVGVNDGSWTYYGTTNPTAYDLTGVGSTNVTVYGNGGSAYAPIGFFATQPAHENNAVVILGDSVVNAFWTPYVGYGDRSGFNWGGCIQSGIGKNIPGANLACPGDSLSYSLTNMTALRFLTIAGARYVILEHGINDVAYFTFAQCTNVFIPFIQSLKSQGLRVCGVTLVPNTTGPWDTVGHQKQKPYESVRQQWNTWVRTNHLYYTYFDHAAQVEVNSNNLPTLNGGYWVAPESYAAYGTATAQGSNPSATGARFLNDTNQNWIPDQWAGYSVSVTNGRLQNLIVHSLRNYLIMEGGGPAFGVNSNYVILRSPTTDGVHLNGYGAKLVGQAYSNAASIFVPF